MFDKAHFDQIVFDSTPALYRSIATRFKLQRRSDIPTRFKTIVRNYKDTATRFESTTAVLPTVVTHDATEITGDFAKLWGEITGL